MEPYSIDDIKRQRRKKHLEKVIGAIPRGTFALIASTEGLPIASTLTQGLNETRIAARTATLLSLSKKAILEIRKGNFDQLYIKGSKGYLVVMQAGPNAVLMVSVTNGIRLGLTLLDCRRICEKIAKLI